MRYTEVVDRINKVISSCQTEKQLHFADKYCHILINKNYGKGIDGYLRKKEFYVFIFNKLQERKKELC